MISLIVTIVFIIFGFILMKYPPTSINNMFGYRTPFSMKNQDTWDESQKYSGFTMIILGVINGIVAIISSMNVININENIQLLVLLIGTIIMIIIDEIHLRKIFNKDGIRKIG